jgi:hypothetical protein
VLPDLARRAAVLGSGAAVAALAALPDPSRPVLLLAGITVAASVAAATLPARVLGTLAVLSATATALLAGALDASSVRPVQMVAVAALLVLQVAALSVREEATAVSAEAVTVARAPWHRLAGPALLALIAGTLVAVTAAQDVVPSVPLVLAGLAAAVTALVIATGGHRT